MDSETFKDSWKKAKPWLDRFTPLWAIIGLLTLHHFVFITRLPSALWPLVDATSLAQLTFSLIIPTFLGYIVFRYSYWLISFWQMSIISPLLDIVLSIQRLPRSIHVLTRIRKNEINKLASPLLFPNQAAWGISVFIIFSGIIPKGVIAPIYFLLGLVLIFPLMVLFFRSMRQWYHWKKRFNFAAIQTLTRGKGRLIKFASHILAFLWLALVVKFLSSAHLFETDYPVQIPALLIPVIIMLGFILAMLPILIIEDEVSFIPEKNNQTSAHASDQKGSPTIAFIIVSILTLFTTEFSWLHLQSKFNDTLALENNGEVSEVSIILPTSKGIILYSHTDAEFSFVADENLSFSVAVSDQSEKTN